MTNSKRSQTPHNHHHRCTKCNTEFNGVPAQNHTCTQCDNCSTNNNDKKQKTKRCKHFQCYCEQCRRWFSYNNRRLEKHIQNYHQTPNNSPQSPSVIPLSPASSSSDSLSDSTISPIPQQLQHNLNIYSFSEGFLTFNIVVRGASQTNESTLLVDTSGQNPTIQINYSGINDDTGDWITHWKCSFDAKFTNEVPYRITDPIRKTIFDPPLSAPLFISLGAYNQMNTFYSLRVASVWIQSISNGIQTQNDYANICLPFQQYNLFLKFLKPQQLHIGEANKQVTIYGNFPLIQSDNHQVALCKGQNIEYIPINRFDIAKNHINFQAPAKQEPNRYDVKILDYNCVLTDSYVELEYIKPSVSNSQSVGAPNPEDMDFNDYINNNLIQDQFSPNALHDYAAQGQIEPIHQLFNFENSVFMKQLNQQDGLGHTPLHNAIIAKNIEIAKYLLRKGASVQIYDDFTFTPFMIAFERCRQYLPELIQVWEETHRTFDRFVSDLSQSLRESVAPYINAENPPPSQKDYKSNGEIYPIYNLWNKNDIHLIEKQQSSMSMDDWEFIERLGKRNDGFGYYGSNSAVYLCKCRLAGLEHPDHYYAIKVCYNIHNVNEEQLLNYQKAEYQLVKKNIVKRTFVRQLSYFTSSLQLDKLPDWDATLIKDGTQTLFVVCELFDGNLKQFWSNEKKHNFPEIGPYILQLLKSLNDLQELNMVHRNIKEDNILYSAKNDCYVLADFGEALTCECNNMHHPENPEMQTWGNPVSMPPEVGERHGDGTIDYSKADIYALAIMFLRLLSSEHGSFLDFDFTHKSDIEKAKVIVESIASEGSYEEQTICNILFAMIRNDRDQRVSVKNAIDVIQYLLWAQNINQEQFEQWKRNRIQEIAKRTLNDRLKMNDVLELEYIVSLTPEMLKRSQKLEENINQHIPLNLHEECENGNLEGVKKCLMNKKKINVNIKDNEGNTPLHFACSQENPEITKRLLENPYIDIQIKNKRGNTPISVARNNENHKMFEIIKDYMECPISYQHIGFYSNLNDIWNNALI